MRDADVIALSFESATRVPMSARDAGKQDASVKLEFR
jgi:hypothetical protein